MLTEFVVLGGMRRGKRKKAKRSRKSSRGRKATKRGYSGLTPQQQRFVSASKTCTVQAKKGDDYLRCMRLKLK